MTQTEIGRRLNESNIHNLVVLSTSPKKLNIIKGIVGDNVSVIPRSEDDLEMHWQHYENLSDQSGHEVTTTGYRTRNLMSKFAVRLTDDELFDTQETIVMGADTVITCSDRIRPYEKPETPWEAYLQLAYLNTTMIPYFVSTMTGVIGVGDNVGVIGLADHNVPMTRKKTNIPEQVSTAMRLYRSGVHRVVPGVVSHNVPGIHENVIWYGHLDYDYVASMTTDDYFQINKKTSQNIWHPSNHNFSNQGLLINQSDKRIELPPNDYNPEKDVNITDAILGAPVIGFIKALEAWLDVAENNSRFDSIERGKEIVRLEVPRLRSVMAT